MDDVALGISREERKLADALSGSFEALEELARLDADGRLARRHRAGAALWLRAARHGVAAPEPWHRDLLGTAAHHLSLRTALEEIGERLAAASVEWVPLKGYDAATRVFGFPEERPTSDLDLLVAPERFDNARSSLEKDGWTPLYSGPRNQAFLANEGYAWMASKPGRPFLELHFRLWGLVPEGWSAVLVERSYPDAPPPRRRGTDKELPRRGTDKGLPAGGRRLELADAYLVAAVHEWLTPPPRPLVAWWDLDRIGHYLTAAEVGEVVRQARTWDIELPVALAARVSAALWGGKACRTIAEHLSLDLRLTERVLAKRSCEKGLVALPLPSLQGARLLAGRPGRLGWRGAWRRLWAHPGIVERSTPATWPWPLRRWSYQMRPLRRRRP